MANMEHYIPVAILVSASITVVWQRRLNPDQKKALAAEVGEKYRFYALSTCILMVIAMRTVSAFKLDLGFTRALYFVAAVLMVFDGLYVSCKVWKLGTSRLFSVYYLVMAIALSIGVFSATR